MDEGTGAEGGALVASGDPTETVLQELPMKDLVDLVTRVEEELAKRAEACERLTREAESQGQTNRKNRVVGKAQAYRHAIEILRTEAGLSPRRQGPGDVA